MVEVGRIVAGWPTKTIEDFDCLGAVYDKSYPMFSRFCTRVGIGDEEDWKFLGTNTLSDADSISRKHPYEVGAHVTVSACIIGNLIRVEGHVVFFGIFLM